MTKQKEKHDLHLPLVVSHGEGNVCCSKQRLVRACVVRSKLIFQTVRATRGASSMDSSRPRAFNLKIDAGRVSRWTTCVPQHKLRYNPTLHSTHVEVQPVHCRLQPQGSTWYTRWFFMRTTSCSNCLSTQGYESTSAFKRVHHQQAEAFWTIMKFNAGESSATLRGHGSTLLGDSVARDRQVGAAVLITCIAICAMMTKILKPIAQISRRHRRARGIRYSMAATPSCSAAI